MARSPSPSKGSLVPFVHAEIKCFVALCIFIVFAPLREFSISTGAVDSLGFGGRLGLDGSRRVRWAAGGRRGDTGNWTPAVCPRGRASRQHGFRRRQEQRVARAPCALAIRFWNRTDQRSFQTEFLCGDRRKVSQSRTGSRSRWRTTMRGESSVS